MPELMIEPDLVARYLDRLYEIGRLPDEARHTIRGWLEDVGLDVREDAVGNLFGRLDDAIRRRGWRARRMVSGAGHDRQVLGRAIPAAMIFVPGRGGRSHSPAEFTEPEQAMRGVQILAPAPEARSPSGLRLGAGDWTGCRSAAQRLAGRSGPGRWPDRIVDGAGPATRPA